MPRKDTTRRRRPRLPQIHYDAAAALRNLFYPRPGGGYHHDGEHAGRVRSNATQWLDVLLSVAGIERGEKKPGHVYVEAIHRLREAGGADDHPAAARVREIALRWQEARNERQAKPAAAAEPQRRTVFINEAVKLRSAGLMPGDSMTVREIDFKADGFTPGELLVLIVSGEKRRGAVVGFVRADEAADGDGILMTDDGGTYQLSISEITTWYRPTALVRTFDAPIIHPAPADERAVMSERLTNLRRRLDKLRDSDEITDCSARFRVEREIDQLERALAKPDPDDWTGFDVLNA